MTVELQSDDFGMMDSYADTVRIPVLPESGLQQRASSERPARRLDRYNTNIRMLTVRSRPPWTSDDMRRLSEAIVRNRHCAK